MTDTGALRELGRLALALGLDAVRAGQGPVPFVVLEDETGELGTTWVIDQTLEAAAIRARHRAATSTCVRYAIGLHEQVRDRDGHKRPGIVVEVGDRGHDTALRMAQPYRPWLSPRQPLEPIGTAIMLGDTINALRGATLAPGPEPGFVVVCPRCGKKNRVALARVRHKLPSCGACHESLLS